MFQAKIGETLPPNAAPLLRKLGLAHLLQDPAHLACFGNQYVWGSAALQDKLFIGHLEPNGWHLHRAVFEAQLAQLAQSTPGIGWRMGCKVLGAVAARPPAPSWQVEIEQDGQRQTLTTAFLVDATGRSAKIGRACGSARTQLDALTGLACTFTLAHPLPQTTSIEAVANGWWYAAPLTGNRLVTLFMTDADLLPQAARTSGGYWQALQQTQHIRSLLPAVPPTGQTTPLTRLASSSYLNQIAGRNWLAVGDAAYAYDPISSYGITSAIGGGFYAGNAIADHLLGKTEALSAYRYLQAQAYGYYLAMLQHQYALERRWPDAPFWQRRHGRFV